MTQKTRKPAKQAKPSRPMKPSKPAKQVKLAKQAAPPKLTKPAGKTYVILGTDEYAKPRAARFSAQDPALLAQAAEAMRLQLVEVTDEDVAELAAKLPTGRLHASGRGLAPYVKGKLYCELLGAAVGEIWPQQNPEPTAHDLPGSWDDVAPGHVVLARETLECGWWEAVVVERNGDFVTVRYRDYPVFHPRVRHRSVVALLSPPAA
jgi:hypothetical protein